MRGRRIKPRAREAAAAPAAAARVGVPRAMEREVVMGREAAAVAKRGVPWAVLVECNEFAYARGSRGQGVLDRGARRASRPGSSAHVWVRASGALFASALCPGPQG